jgi:hypothetical protein
MVRRNGPVPSLDGQKGKAESPRATDFVRANAQGWTRSASRTAPLAPRTGNGPDRLLHFLANQLRVLLTAAAYVLMQELRLIARRGEHARAQVSTLRDRVSKHGIRVEHSVPHSVASASDLCLSHRLGLHRALCCDRGRYCDFHLRL